jgi:hypothetical protein
MSPRHHASPDPSPDVAYLTHDACFANLAGDYRYMTSGYYISQDLEAAAKPVHPTCKEVLDGYIVPLFLERVKLAGLRTPVYYVTNDYFEPPVIVDSLNPFMPRQSIVYRARQQDRVAKSLTRNFTYAICCQEFPSGARIAHFRAVLGWSVRCRFRPLAATIWQVFRIPLAAVRVIILGDDDILLSGLKPLPFKRLTARELHHLHAQVTWQI